MPRRNDGALFAYDVHIKFFRDMKAYLKSIGVRIPITATGRFEDLADLKSMSEELDFIGSNFYYDHPYWAQGAKAWTPPSFFHNHNPMSDVDDRSMAAAVSLARIKNKPFVVREWNYCWPNRNRAAGMVEAAAYAALHDIDAMILFVYETRPTAEFRISTCAATRRVGACAASVRRYF
jgi:exo-beta-1,3-glucanase (GH17 family)